MTDTHLMLRDLYAALNRRDMEAALALMTDTVSWPCASEGGRVTGRDEIRAYWTRQWAEFDPLVTPYAIELSPDGRYNVQVHQIVRSRSGDLLSDLMVVHTFTLDNGRVTRMDLDETVSAFSRTEAQ